MHKRILVIFTALVLLLTGIGVSAAEETVNLLRNGDFEIVNADGTATGWSGGNGEIKTSKKIKKDGETSLYINTAAGDVYTTQSVTHMVGGTQYKVSGYIYVVRGSAAKPVIKLEYYDAVGAGRKNVGEETLKIEYTENRWVPFALTVTAPQEAFAAGVLLRAYGEGSAEIYYDGVAVMGKRAEGYEETPLVPSTEVAAATPATTATGEKKDIEPEKAEIPYDENTAREFVKNGDFEKISSEGSVGNWTISKGSLGKEYLLETKDVPSGEKYMRMVPSGENDLFVSQQLYGLVSLAEYKISTYVRLTDIPQNRYPTIKLEIYGADGHIGEKTVTNETVKKGGEWEKWEFTFIAPEGANRANILVRIPTKTGDVSYDLVSMKGPHAMDYPPEVDPATFPAVEKKEPAAGSEELLTNLDFETAGEDGNPANWEPYKGWDGGIVSVEREIVHSGNTAIKITTDTSNNPWLRQEVRGMVPGVEYQMSSWVRSSFISGKGISYKFEWYNEEGKSVDANGTSETMGYLPLITGEHWYNFVQTFSPPEGASVVKIYLRLYGAGTVYFDDVSCYRTGVAPRFELKLDEYFVYTENEAGWAEAVPNLTFYPELTTATLHFRLLDGETVLREERGVPIMNGKARFKFYTADLPEKQKPYTVEASIVDSAGTVLETNTDTVYRYDRPKVLDEAGNYIIDGEIFHPVFAYHVNTKYYPRMKEIGVNVVQGAANAATLDAAWENGLRVLVILYNGMKPAGSPEKVEETRRLVAELKDHPAVYAWAIMDEPYHHDPNCLPHLKNSYIEIRNIDPVHPVYVMEDGNNFVEASKCCDIFGIDPYPAGKNNPLTHIADRGLRAKDGGAGRKPVYNLLQMFTYGDYYPTDDELRSMIYQVFFGGGTSVGYYQIDSTFGGKPVFEVEGPYNTLKEWTEKEYQDTYDFFVDRDYPVFNEQKNEDVWSISFPKDGKLRVIALNQHTDKEAVLSLPLESTDGSVKIGAFSANVYAGGTAASFSGDGTFEATLQPGGAVVYEITPAESVDFSGLFISKFTDMETHAWARAAVEVLEEKGAVYGISPEFFGPAREITRGEFASFLVRALGLTAGEGAEQFTDVYAGAAYAADIAAGKAAGILQGMGDGRFCPDRLITRQDMMTMVSRGLAITGEADLSGFSDAGLLAEYARSHASAMIESGLIKGNADGTLNPLGFTTRAEAAVLMQRITER